jgi:glycosyltransferase involved in cell wall biosynthesis
VPLTGDPELAEIIVVDDERSDPTAAAGQRGATVRAGRALPPGRAGKAGALDQGPRAARGDLVLVLDADTLPRSELARAPAAELSNLIRFSARATLPTSLAQVSGVRLNINRQPHPLSLSFPDSRRSPLAGEVRPQASNFDQRPEAREALRLGPKGAALRNAPVEASRKPRLRVLLLDDCESSPRGAKCPGGV